ncbi:MAG TPA: hypothetical protein VFQ43_11395 [Nitrososphaera sp.]|nr:hypothetical protein [Nitrososphaera sp.]
MNKSAAALRMAVELRNHPRMSYRKVPSWPPSWVWISGSEDKQPKGEVGILKQVRMVNGHPIVHRCFLWMEYEDGTYLGCLLLDNLSFCKQLSRLLEKNVGRSVKEIGGLDLSYLSWSRVSVRSGESLEQVVWILDGGKPLQTNK